MIALALKLLARVVGPELVYPEHAARAIAGRLREEVESER